jgi:hypothetical protein
MPLRGPSLGGESDQFEPRRFSQVYDRTFSRVHRLSVFSHIEQEIVTAFSEDLIADNPELLERAYVTTADRTRFDDRIKMYLFKRDQVINTRPMRPVGRGEMPEISSRIRSIKVTARPIAILTLGLVGSGKTTFLSYIRQVSAKEFFTETKAKPSAHWVYVDFRNFSPETSARKFIVSRIFDYIAHSDFLSDFDRCLRHAYSTDITNLKKGPLALLSSDEQTNRLTADMILKEYQEQEPYALKIMSYASKNAPIFIVIDNVDQIESTDAQAAIFLEALTIARSVGANLILGMRDSTYLRNKTSAIFDAFDFDRIYIDPPDVQSVLSKRFVIAEQLLKDKTFEFVNEGGAKITVKNAQTLVEMFSFGVLGTEVGRLIEVAATGDIRLALQMTRQFLQYGYTSTAKGISVYQRTGRFRLPPHEALRAIMLGNQSIYSDEYSPIGNPFDAKLAKSDAQLLRLFILNALVNSASEKTFSGMDVSDIITNLEKIGFSERNTERVCRDLIQKRFLFSRSHQEYSRDSVLVPSRLAGYVVRDLCAKFIFLETTLFDTFISDEARWTSMKDLMRRIYSEHDTVSKFRLRKEIVTEFFHYLEAKMQRLVDEAQRRALPAVWCSNPLPRLKGDFEREMTRALSSALRNYGPIENTDINRLPLFQDRRTAT